MLNAVRVFLKGEFNRSVLTLVTGTGVAQLIPLAASPLLSRMYSPEQFGIFALFTATVSSVSVLATGRYELAIMLPRDDVDATNIAALSITISIVVSACLLVTAWAFNTPISSALGNDAMSTWLYLVPLSVFLNSIYSNLNYWCNRNKLYSLMAHRQVLHSGGTCSIQLALGGLRAGAGGLIIGSLCGQAIAAGMMWKMVRRHIPNVWQDIEISKLFWLAKNYRSCFQFLVPAHTISALTILLPTFFINVTFGLAASGFFMLAERVVGMPLSLVSTSVGAVFRKNMTERYLEGRRCKREFVATFNKLTAIATPPFLVLMLVAPSLFSLVFGEKWRISGEYAQLMCPMFYTRFIVNPLSLMAIVAQKNKYEFFWHFSLLVFLLLAATSHTLVQLQLKTYILVFVTIFIVFDLVNLAVSYKFACAGDLQGRSRLRS